MNEKKANIERLQADKIALTKDLVVLKQQFKDKDIRQGSAVTERRAPQPSACDQIKTQSAGYNKSELRTSIVHSEGHETEK